MKKHREEKNMDQDILMRLKEIIMKNMGEHCDSSPFSLEEYQGVLRTIEKKLNASMDNPLIEN